MKKIIFAKVGSDEQIIEYSNNENISIPDGYIKTNIERPDVNYIMSNTGNWIINKEKYIEKNKHYLNKLFQEVNITIEILQDIVDLGMQENNEDEQLKAWKKYRILLTRIDTNNIEITWPTKPQ